ncbi:hypothetical protein HN803_03725 [candidate division WWE3 bacterium]|nr:hypothetical protein [candidate division WWE3 bacterium]
MIEKFTIMRTRRWGNSHTEVTTAAVLMRNKASADDARILANTLLEKEEPGTNVEIEFEVLHARENGEVDVIHHAERKGVKSI